MSDFRPEYGQVLFYKCTILVVIFLSLKKNTWYFYTSFFTRSDLKKKKKSYDIQFYVNNLNFFYYNLSERVFVLEQINVQELSYAILSV